MLISALMFRCTLTILLLFHVLSFGHLMSFGPVVLYGADSSDVVDYTSQIKPILTVKCY